MRGGLRVKRGTFADLRSSWIRRVRIGCPGRTSRATASARVSAEGRRHHTLAVTALLEVIAGKVAKLDEGAIQESAGDELLRDPGK